jgi:hypothetical protein
MTKDINIYSLLKILILDRKGSRRSKPIEKPTQLPPNFNPSFMCWDIHMNVPNLQALNIILEILGLNSEWVFIWTRRHRTENFYILSGYIMFEFPHTETWFHHNLGNLGNGHYINTHEHPNDYRNRNIAIMHDLNQEVYDILIRIDDGLY